jgi:WD40 repeat protein/predicted Ser/Thr protein kinase
MLHPSQFGPTAPPEVPGFSVERELGRGGMGVVYLAWQRGLNRVVALKMILHGSLASAKDLVRFLGEAEAVAKVQHPNIVQIYQFGRVGDFPYFALEYVNGGTLHDRLRENPLEPKEAARIVEQLARAMARCHAEGIIHRDLKPGNILMTRDGVPKITDFGLAKRLDSGEGMTVSGTPMGTPSYMSPEQASGTLEAVGVTSDVYSLGAILYTTLTGRPPFVGPNSMAILAEVLRSEPIIPRDLLTSIPRDLETICLKALEKKPDRRYSSAEALADDLHRFLKGQSIQARRATLFERTQRWIRRHPWPSLAFGIFLLSFAAITLLALMAIRAETRAQDQQILGSIPQAALNLDAGNRLRAARLLEAIPPTRRHWEWFHLQQENPLLSSYQDQTESIQAIALSGDHRYLATASLDKSVCIWDRQTGTCLTKINDETLPKPHTSLRPIYAVALHPTRPLVAFGDESGGLLVWNFKSQQLLLDRRRDHPNSDYKTISTVAFSPDGNWLAWAGWNNSIEVRSVNQLNDPGLLISAHSQNVEAIGFLPLQSGKTTLVSASWDQSIALWEIPTGKKLQELRDPKIPPQEKITALAIPEHGQTLLVGFTNGRLTRWNLEGARPFTVSTGSQISAIAYHPHSNSFVTAGKDRQITLWDSSSLQRLRKIGEHGNEVQALLYADDGQHLISAGSDRKVHQWKLEARANHRRLLTPQWPENRLTALASDQEANWLVASSRDKSVKIFKRSGDDLVQTLQTDVELWSVAITGDGQIVAACGDAREQNDPMIGRKEKQGLIRLWDRETGELRRSIPVPDTQTSLVFSRDQKTLFSSGHDAKISLWEVSSGTLLKQFEDGPQKLECLALSANQRWLASGSWGGGLRLRDLHSSNPHGQSLAGHFENINSVAFSPDNRYLASVSNDGSLRIWEVNSGKLLAATESCTGPLNGLAWSPDAERLAYAGQNGDLKLWHTDLREELLTLRGSGEAIRCLWWSPDGSEIYAGGFNGSLQVWEGLRN